MNSIVCFAESCVLSDVHCRRDLTCRRFVGWTSPIDAKFSVTSDAELYVHWRVSVHRMAIQEDIVSICTQTRVSAQNPPHLIQSRAPG